MREEQAHDTYRALRLTAGLFGLYEPPPSLHTPLAWPKYEQKEDEDGPPQFEGNGENKAKIKEIDDWAAREQREITYISGAVITRVNEKTGRLEALLVNGLTEDADGNKVRKEFWQFAGGKARPGEDPEQTLTREIFEELGMPLTKKLGTISYLNTYIPEPKPEQNKHLAINAFRIRDCKWTDEELRAGIEAAGSDVDDFMWVDAMPVDERGDGLMLTEQTDYILRRVLGFQGPKNKNTPRDEYNGNPLS